MALLKNTRSSLIVAERVLLVMIVLLGVYLTHALTSPEINVEQYFVGGPVRSLPEDAPVPSVPLQELKPFAFYQQQIQNQNIFSLPLPEGTDVFVDQQIQAVAASSTQNALPAHLKIVAILVGKPSEIMIEDAQKGQTYLVVEGKKQDGFVFSKIAKGMIFLQHEGQNFEIPF